MSDYFDVNVDDPQKVLFMGHRGSGKSSELYLSCLAVIEYNGDRWCGLHPAVVDYFSGKGEIAG